MAAKAVIAWPSFDAIISMSMLTTHEHAWHNQSIRHVNQIRCNHVSHKMTDQLQNNTENILESCKHVSKMLAQSDSETPTCSAHKHKHQTHTTKKSMKAWAHSIPESAHHKKQCGAKHAQPCANTHGDCTPPEALWETTCNKKMQTQNNAENYQSSSSSGSVVVVVSWEHVHSGFLRTDWTIPILRLLLVIFNRQPPILRLLIHKTSWTHVTHVSLVIRYCKPVSP